MKTKQAQEAACQQGTPLLLQPLEEARHRPGELLHATPGRTMRTWQKIFAQKVADMHVKEPWTLQEDDSLQVHSPKPGRREYLQNHAAGRFQCSQCLHEWSSAKVHILFHMRRGKVRMRIFRQACRRCLSPQLEEPTFSQENLERILHNLVLQILKDFYKVPVQPSDLLEVVVDTKLAGPHDSSRCEGCQLGVCSKPRAAPKPPAWKPKRHVDTATSPPRQLLSSGFPRKCCFVLLAVCIVAVVLFILLYFTLK